MTNLPSSSILVVDDNPTNLKVLFDVLQDCNYKVTIAKNGENALSKAQRSQPDLILLDVLMPGIDGFETCRRLKANEQTRSIPVIFMTALSETVNKVKGLKLGAVDYITKPFDHDEVLARIQVHLDLKAAQLKLIQEFGQSTLGQLVAGIAHEINNPVNFVYGNLDYATEYHQEIMHLLELYERHYPDPHPEIKEWESQIDLPFLKKDYFQLLDSMKIGAERIKGLVISLRIFSRLDQSEYKLANLHEGVESIFHLIEHRLQEKPYRPAIEVVKDYADLPLIRCYPAQLNQVLMNLLINGIDAIDTKCSVEPQEEAKKSKTPQLRITTRVEEQENRRYAQIQIADNGVGISEAVQQRMFEQFFTTKKMGKGTGLGLAIARQIIEEKHHGTIAYHSELGKGTEFTLLIPYPE
ncbi:MULTISPECIES: response regulator [unclassified Roseofilum]|uniref:hybrid sensor histidine kinase/response regulator n=1 Tax=unclassified Roseofilum TaxID=2620099 RepID=UPI000E970891|nr:MULTISPECIES: response regulator [unclassified Roseofilum]MBP0011321.1 hybrid sensor histidine kinase/response regulator [Roseofilum sp. Belize Diploria]MBP0034774.1 hybrid sensor histidine kinase/response regulator [Roseofilum sp. Belize BBD 4]HBQ99148.1 hybrid sensor histidine kinase/response regulator [Cyanobacteria bacterium UBA11691]